MKEQLISFTTAKLAKEKNFPQYGSSAYVKRPDEDYWYTPTFSGLTRPETEAYNAVSQSVLQAWLRREHYLIVTPTTDFVAWAVEVCHPDKGTVRIDINTDKHWIGSYEEALELGLQEALKMI